MATEIGTLVLRMRLVTLHPEMSVTLVYQEMIAYMV
jgi:hypothetical protein